MTERRGFFKKIAAVFAAAVGIPSAKSEAVNNWEAMARESDRQLGEEKNERERREVTLAGVSAAAHGSTLSGHIAKHTDWAWHPAYQDTLDLRRKFDAMSRMLAERSPSGQSIMFYACGCSALANIPCSEMPMVCGACEDDCGAVSVVVGKRVDQIPSIVNKYR